MQEGLWNFTGIGKWSGFGVHEFEKKYDKIPGEVLCNCLEKKNIPFGYICVFRDIYKKVKTKVKMEEEDIEGYHIELDCIKV